MRRRLNLFEVDEKQLKDQYKRSLDMAFEFNKKRVPEYRNVLRILEKDASFRTWKDSDCSAVLVLSGHSSGTYAAQRFCWLSAAAIELISHLQASDCPVAFFNGQLGTTPPDWKDRAASEKALRSIMGQIASWDLSHLQKIDYEQHIGHEDWNSDDLGRKTKFLQALLNPHAAVKPVYLVLDNLQMDNEASTSLERPVLIRRLLELIRDVQGVVKILLVGLKEDFDATGLKSLKEIITGLSDEQIIYRLAWDSAKAQRIPVY